MHGFGCGGCLPHGMAAVLFENPEPKRNTKKDIDQEHNHHKEPVDFLKSNAGPAGLRYLTGTNFSFEDLPGHDEMSAFTRLF